MVARIHANYRARTGTGKNVQRVELAEIPVIKRNVLLEILKPDPEVSTEFQAALRSRLGLPADFGVPATNAVLPAATSPNP